MTGESSRERDVLHRLASFRALNTAQLEEFLFSGSAVKPRSRELTTARILARLRRRGLIAATPRLVGGPGGGSARRVHHLTDAGFRFVRTLDPALGDQRAPARSSLFIEHALMTADVAIAFHRYARAHSGHSLAEWAPEWQAADRLGSFQVVPDGLLVYATEAWEIQAFVEIDLGSERPSRFAQKITAYLAVYREGAWRRRLASWPIVLTVAPDATRATALRRASEDVLRLEGQPSDAAVGIEFAFAALADLSGEGGPFGRIWHVADRPGVHTLVPASRPDGEVPSASDDRPLDRVPGPDAA
ncbi:MAG: replication-relaxation family protein [Chloroflexota bacterium]|nr:replication-relaxation family protein [Chloroflexota bacterium]